MGCNDWPWAPPSFFNICSDKHGNLDYPNNWTDYFDCGYNEELFLAVAALRNDGYYMQWFTDGKHWVLCDREDWVDMYSVLRSGGKYKQEDMDKFHKATVRELSVKFDKSLWIPKVVAIFFIVLGILEFLVLCFALIILFLEEEKRVLEISDILFYTCIFNLVLSNMEGLWKI